jgi:hypothetical protein
MHVDYEFSGSNETINNTSHIKKSQPGLKIHRLTINMHVHNHNRFSGSESMCNNTSHIKKSQPGLKILRIESDNQPYIHYQIFPARIKNS